MKKAFLILSSVIALSSFSSDVLAQKAEKNIRVVIDNAGSDRAFQDKEKKKLDFAVQGLDQAQVTAFEDRVKSFDGVKSLQISKDEVNGSRKAHIEFNETYTESYFQKLLIYSDVDMLVVNGKRKPVKKAAQSR